MSRIKTSASHQNTRYPTMISIASRDSESGWVCGATVNGPSGGKRVKEFVVWGVIVIISGIWQEWSQNG